MGCVLCEADAPGLPYPVSKALLDEGYYINIVYCRVLVAVPLSRFCENLTLNPDL